MGWERVGTFTGNMKLPIHRWFRYSAGYSAEWVKHEIEEYCQNSSNSTPVVLDPYSGVGTTIIAAEELGIKGFGIEAHWFIDWVANCKVNSNVDTVRLLSVGLDVLEEGIENPRIVDDEEIPKLMRDTFPDREILFQLWGILDAIKDVDCDESIRGILKLVLISSLRPCSPVGTSNWQYILPKRRKKKINAVMPTFKTILHQFTDDINTRKQDGNFGALAEPIFGDARNIETVQDDSIDLVITSPPYANNYDYADATRFELTFLGEIENWGDLHDNVRKDLIISSAQHASKVKPDAILELDSPLLSPIKDELSEAFIELKEIRLDRGGKKHYHTMVVSYMLGIAETIKELDRVMKDTNVRAQIVIGDSAPYGVHIPVDDWISRISEQYGFKSQELRIRDRNNRWENRVHKVPLKEIILTLER